jgi:hypothetical protein
MGVPLASLGSALLTVSAKGLGPPWPYAAFAAGPGDIALQRDLQSCLTRKQNIRLSINRRLPRRKMLLSMTFDF